MSTGRSRASTAAAAEAAVEVAEAEEATWTAVAAASVAAGMASSTDSVGGRGRRVVSQGPAASRGHGTRDVVPRRSAPWAWLAQRAPGRQQPHTPRMPA